MAKNSGGRQWFRWLTGAAPMLVCSRDFKSRMASGWASSTCGVCMAPAARRLSNGGEKLMTKRREKRETEREKEREECLGGRMGGERETWSLIGHDGPFKIGLRG